MTTTTLPRTFDHLTWHRGRRTGAPYPIGHAGPCPTASDVEPGTDLGDEPWPCATCFPSVGSAREVAFDAARSFPTGTDRVARAAAAVEADPRVAEAVAFAKAYAGTFDFLVAMREKAQKAHWIPTPNMVNAILKCKARDDERTAARAGAPVSGSTSTEDRDAPSEKQTAFVRSLLDERAGIEEAEDVRRTLNSLRERGELTRPRVSMAIEALLAIPARRSAVDLPDVPEGKYAVDTEKGAENEVAFYSVDRPTEGKWAGRTFVNRLQGAPGSWNQIPVRGEAAKTILGKILEAGPAEAAARFGHLTKTCGRCEAPLSNFRSRAAGYGQTCAGKLGWFYPSPEEARAILAARGESVEDEA